MKFSGDGPFELCFKHNWELPLALSRGFLFKNIFMEIHNHSLISTGCDCCTTPPLYCICTEAEYFLFSSRLVNVAMITLLGLASSADMFMIPVTLTQEELQASTVTLLTAFSHTISCNYNYSVKCIMLATITPIKGSWINT